MYLRLIFLPSHELLHILREKEVWPLRKPKTNVDQWEIQTMTMWELSRNPIIASSWCHEMGSPEEPVVFRVAVQELPKVPSYLGPTPTPWALGVGALSDKQNLILHKCLVRKPGDPASGQLVFPRNALSLAELRSGASCFAMGAVCSRSQASSFPTVQFHVPH